MARVLTEPSLAFSDVLMAPQHSRLPSRKDAKLFTLLTTERLMGMPLISANMQAVTEWSMAAAMYHLGGMGALHRFMSVEENVEQYQKVKSLGADCIISLGIHEKLERIDRLYQAGARIFLVDVAHADSDPVVKFVKSLSTKFHGIEIIAGNIATSEAVMRLEEAGANAVKVGIGPGAACTTRQVTGAGRGQLTAIMDCADVATVPVIADGGISTSGDIVKAIGAGAFSVMLGRLLAGCDESPEPGFYWGNASRRVNGHRAPEGVEGTVPRTGSLEDTIKPLLWGLRSGISYAGYQSVSDLIGNGVFERISAGVVAESAARV